MNIVIQQVEGIDIIPGVHRVKELEERLRPEESKPPTPDNSKLIKAAEDWIMARGFDPYDSGHRFTIRLHFNESSLSKFARKERCKLEFDANVG